MWKYFVKVQYYNTICYDKMVKFSFYDSKINKFNQIVVTGVELHFEQKTSQDLYLYN